jgi:putative ABC transport system substrate-binding protein
LRRRDFILAALAGTVGGASTFLVRPTSGRAESVRLIGALIGLNDRPEIRAFVAAFVEELGRLGWIDGRNARIELRWTNADVNRARAFAKELVAAQPDVVLTSTTSATAALHRETSTIPVVFTVASDPAGEGFVAGLSRPGGNITGFTHTEPGLAGKSLSLLKEIAPRIKRVGIIFNPDTAPGRGKFFLGSFEAAARSLAVEPVTLPVRTDVEIESAIAALGREQAGLAGMDDAFISVHQTTIISSSARNKVPAILVTAEFVRDGGLISYVTDPTDLFRRATGYVDRILRGENPADLPVQTPTKFEMAINLKTATALGLTVPPALLATADEVIE